MKISIKNFIQTIMILFLFSLHPKNIFSEEQYYSSGSNEPGQQFNEIWDTERYVHEGRTVNARITHYKWADGTHSWDVYEYQDNAMVRLFVGNEPPPGFDPEIQRNLATAPFLPTIVMGIFLFAWSFKNKFT